MTEQKTVVKKKAPTKAKTTKAKATTQEKVDAIEQTVSEIENLNKESALSLFQDILNNNDFNFFKIGGILSVIQDNGWYQDEGFDTLREFVETNYGFSYRKAMYWIQIYNSLVNSEVPWDDVKHLGWSKLRIIAPVLTIENSEEYIKLAGELNQQQLREHLKNEKKGSIETGDGAGTDDVVDNSKKLSNKTFKVHNDQLEVINEALEEAKNSADTEFDAVALEAICLQFMQTDGGASVKAPKPVKQLTLSEIMNAEGMEAVFEEFENLWPSVELSVTMPDDEEVPETNEDESPVVDDDDEEGLL